MAFNFFFELADRLLQPRRNSCRASPDKTQSRFVKIFSLRVIVAHDLDHGADECIDPVGVAERSSTSLGILMPKSSRGNFQKIGVQQVDDGLQPLVVIQGNQVVVVGIQRFGKGEDFICLGIFFSLLNIVQV